MFPLNKLRAQMAERFMESLTQGDIPWKACWQQDRPMNAITGKPYRGVNAMFLSYIADEKGYHDPRWCTYNQAKERGWQVCKGEKSALIEYWAYFDVKEKKMLSWADARKLYKEDREYAVNNLQLRSRCYNVFNAEQMDGVPERKQPHTDIGKLRSKRDTLLRNMAVKYQEVAGSGAFYRPRTDTITLPPEATFDDTYGYMATFLHESAHATGHECRLNRDMSGQFGSPEYAREELRAEIASAFTVQALGLQLSDTQLEYQLQQHSAYVQSWAAALQKAPEELFQAIRAAEEISDYLLEEGEFLLEEESFYAKVLYKSFDGESIPSFYDDRTAYLQEIQYQESQGGRNCGIELSKEEFLRDVSEALVTQGHHMVLGANLTGDYTEEIRDYMEANPPEVQVHPWMMMENVKTETVYQWEQEHLPNEPEAWSVRSDGHTGQLLIQPGKQKILDERYMMCCREQTAEIVQETPALEDWEQELEP